MIGRLCMGFTPEKLEASDLDSTYNSLLTLWTSGIRDYHSLLSDYLTANSIFVAVLGFLLARQPVTVLFSIVIIILCMFGMLMSLQMAIVLGRFSTQNFIWEWRLRGIEQAANWRKPTLFVDLHRFRDQHAQHARELAPETLMVLPGSGEPDPVVGARVALVAECEYNLVSNVDREAAEHGASPGRQPSDRVEHELMRDNFTRLCQLLHYSNRLYFFKTSRRRS